jgi:RNA-directed DNA polymerase
MRLGGGKAVPVKEEDLQLLLTFATAESPRKLRGAGGTDAVDPSTENAPLAPKAKGRQGQTGPATMEGVVGRLDEALDKAAANRGAPGPDRQTAAEVQAHWPKIRGELTANLLAGTYRPGEIRCVWIPKAGGEQRGLGIPNVIERAVQEAVRSVLEPISEPTFHRSSHGFRPNRSCQTAITEARG